MKEAYRMQRWFITMKKADFNRIGEKYHLSPIVARLIRNRDIIGDDAIDFYLNGTIADLYDGMLMKDMGVKYKDVRNQPSLDFHEVPSFVERLVELHTIPSLMFCFSILTCSRSQAVRLMTWGEIDFEKRIWVVPEEHDKVKGNTRFRTIMLNEQSLYILQQCRQLHLSHDSDQLVFPNVHRGSQPYGDNFFMSFIRVEHAKKKKEDSIGWVDVKTGLRITQHGFRSSFKTWSVSDELGNNKKYDREVSEYCLLHSKSDPYNGGYERCDFEIARREMMDDWGKWCWSAINNKVR